MTTLGWLLVALPIVLAGYSYAGFPFLLWLATRGKRPAHAIPPTTWPMISIVVPAYNEEAQIRGTIEALLRQDYPADRRQILILSDASTDATDRIVEEYADRGVELMRMPVRAGKTAAENASRPRLKGEIIVNSDASVRLAPHTVRLLVESMNDSSVGVASTRDVSVLNHEIAANSTEASYVGYEMKLRHLETLSGGIVGASGSGYAIRRRLHDIRVPDMLSRDFSAALNAEVSGLRAISVDDAVCYVPRTASLWVEYRRKVRTISRGMDTLIYRRVLLDPIRHGAFAWKLWSHKVCRWLLPVAAIPGTFGLIVLAQTHLWAWIILGLAAAAAAVVAIGATWPAGKPMPNGLSMVTFAAFANIAVLHAITRIIFGHNDHVWEPTRRTVAPTSA
ncbi:MAG TPA: glycosyltransferase [Gemmatimonadaceae bacterium]|jgi:cellulose synthase/poly-beta-1,6-N-acetylglucosamine synthase-like glycosyltransferase|nr:glycosyltransferase [Gemmatimonadaceae bacterium]